MGLDYLKRILNAKVYDVAIETPLEHAHALSERTGNRVYLKREDMQKVFSFKLRGAYNKMAHLTPAQLERGVIAASAGNHAQGVAVSAARLKCMATIVMPTTTPSVKIEAVRRFGGDWVNIVLHGESYSDSATRAFELAAQEGLTFVHPFDDPDVIAGQGTVGMEILRQHQAPIHAIFVAIGGGGLAAGVATYVKQLRPDIRVIGVQTADSDAMAQSIEHHQRVTLNDVGLFSDGTAVKLVGEETFKLCEQYLDDVVRVSTDETCAAIKDVFQDTRSILEPAGALAVAGLKQYAELHGLSDQTLIAVSCGANMNFDRLRFVAERAQVGEQREAVFAVTIPEERGSFRRFCELLGPRNVTEFNYRMADDSKANIFVGVETSHRGEADELLKLFTGAGFDALNLTDDELAKAHLRHMVGGRSTLADHELLHRFEFPERPGALMRFLSSLNPGWNISLFHYRNHGSDYGRILVGIQVPPDDRQEFADFLSKLDYRFWDETDNPAYKLFLK
ncbi:threonine ammonia-lyase, biosynthetic [Limnobacter sp.]|uniref:threonine ammonia-lyase, biosynthetic n=1 Tax=Limnobacter sp. TaxID=2003368 RepID=UPI00258E84D4|nr:threonine ammonia-lyase, biosynthetic [Limnobacter sp.]